MKRYTSALPLSFALLTSITLSGCVDQYGFSSASLGQSNDKKENPVAENPPLEEPPVAEPPVVDPPVVVVPPAPEPSVVVVPPAPSPVPSVVVVPPPAPSPEPSVVVPPPPVVCDINDKSNIVDSKLGLRGHIYSGADHTEYTSSEQYVVGAKDLGVELYMNQLNLPTREFMEGFATTDGTILQDTKGNRLVEYFALAFESSLRLSDGDAEGKYQLAILSDDGASMRINNGAKVLIANEGKHATKMKCASETISLKRGDRLPFKLSYFQGPRMHIAMVLMWRKVQSDSGAELSDSECGKSGNDYFFNSKTSAPLSPYQGLLNRGWKPIANDNFELTEGFNRCTMDHKQ